MADITDKRLRELQRAEAKLITLENGGVDNWDGYSDALEEYNKQNELEDTKEALLDELELVFGECAYEPSERGAGIAFTRDIFDSAMAVLDRFNVQFGSE